MRHILTCRRYIELSESILRGSNITKDLVELSEEERGLVSEYALRIVDYRRTGISLNHIIGCPMDCAYCVRHFWGNFDMKQPHMLCSDEDAIELLISDERFIPNEIPIQFLHKATDPFLPSVKEHTFRVIKKLDELNFRNVVMLITRFSVTEDDLKFLNSLQSIQPCIFITYSGITDTNIEPIALSGMFETTVQTMKKRSLDSRCKFVQYWRPIVKDWNDDDNTILRVLSYSDLFDAIVIKGLRHKKENDLYFTKKGIKINHQYGDYKKWFEHDSIQRIMNLHASCKIKTPIFTKTSCAISYVCGRADYNLQCLQKTDCRNCSEAQKKNCQSNIKNVNESNLVTALSKIGKPNIQYDIFSDHVEVEGIDNDDKNYLIHALKFCVDIK